MKVVLQGYPAGTDDVAEHEFKGRESALISFEWTYWGKSDRATFHPWLKTLGKRCEYQQELGEKTQGLHYQGKIHLKKRSRLSTLLTLVHAGPMAGMNLTPTLKDNLHDWSYVNKLQTRVAGPWTLGDPDPKAMPNRIKGITLKPFQQAIIDHCQIPDERHINCLIDPIGCRGKSTTCDWAWYYGMGVLAPPSPDAKHIMAHYMQVESRAYFYDCPKDFFTKKGQAQEFWSAIESIKNGYAWDGRHTHREVKRPYHPVIWIMANSKPESTKLSQDRWVYWMVDHEEKLIRWTMQRDANMWNIHQARLKKRKHEYTPVECTSALDDKHLDLSKFL